MNTPLRRVSLVVMGLIVLLLGQATWVQVVKADDYKSNQYNQRVLLDEYSRQRGQISANGQVLAASVPTNDRLKYLRQYSSGPMYAPITGYYSQVYGSNGIERAEDSVLNGSDDRLFVRRISDVITGRVPAGGNVALTIDPKVQQAAYDAMTSKRLHRQRRRDPAADRGDPRDGVHAVLRPEPAGQPRQRRAEGGVERAEP